MSRMTSDREPLTSRFKWEVGHRLEHAHDVSLLWPRWVRLAVQGVVSLAFTWLILWVGDLSSVTNTIFTAGGVIAVVIIARELWRARRK